MFCTLNIFLFFFLQVKVYTYLIYFLQIQIAIELNVLSFSRNLTTTKNKYNKGIVSTIQGWNSACFLLLDFRKIPQRDGPLLAVHPCVVQLSSQSILGNDRKLRLF